MPVVGCPGSGKTNMLAVLAKQFMEKERAQVVMVDVKKSLLSSHPENCYYITEIEEFDSYMESLVPTLRERKEAHDRDAGRHFAPIAIFVDNFKTAYEQMLDVSAKRMEAIIRLGEGLDVYLYIAEDADAFCRMHAQGEVVSVLMAKENTAILLGGSFTSYPVFHSEMSGLEKNQVLGEREGYLLQNEKTTKFKTMSMIS